MQNELQSLLQGLEQKIRDAYTNGVTLEQAERLASEFLYAQIQVSQELQAKDLDARMRKSGVKAVRAAIYADVCSKTDKKPTEAAIDHSINSNDVVQGEQDGLDTAEATRDELERYFHIFKDAHIHYRGVSRGKFE